VRALLLDGTNLYAGGSFTNAGGAPALNVARWDGTQWSSLGDGIPGFDSCLFGSCLHPVTSLALVKGKLFAGGGFVGPFWAPRGYLARWDGSTWTNVIDGDWSMDSIEFRDFFDPLHVWALASQGSDLYIAGNFAAMGDVRSYGFSIWHDGSPPALQIRFSGSRLVLSAPREFQYAAVEFSESLSPPLWKPVANLNWQVSQTATNCVEGEITPARSPTFYRLRWD
jgi:hypothetical protein